MGIADHWIRLVKDVRDEAWHLGTLWYELTCHRPEERTISYAECHDQALVGDQTLMMRLMGAHIYTAMGKNHPPVITTRAVALHKMIRLITLACAHSGYLNFMGNEFGHPDWVDFPSRQNRFSFDHARRQWSLKYDKALYYSDLFEFDRQMTALARTRSIFSSPDIRLLALHEQDKVLAFERGKMVFAFNFHAHASYTGYQVDGPPGKYAMILDTDEERFGGQARLTPGQVHFTQPDAANRPDADSGRHWLSLYLPSRCALVLEKI